MPVNTPDLFFLLAEEVLDCICVSLEEESTCPCPCRRCVVLGDPAWDQCECGQLTIGIDRIYVHDNFPVASTGPIFCSSPLAGDFTVTLLRCVPTVKDDGSPPTCQEISDSSRQIYSDMYISLRALICCLAAKKRMSKFLIREAAPITPDGGCGGFRIRFTSELVDPPV